MNLSSGAERDLKRGQIECNKPSLLTKSHIFSIKGKHTYLSRATEGTGPMTSQQPLARERC